MRSAYKEKAMYPSQILHSSEERKIPISKPFTDTESFMLEGTFLGYPVQPPQFKKGQLEQGVLNCVQTGFEYLHGWTHLSEQTILLTTFTVNTLPFQNCFSRQTLLTI